MSKSKTPPTENGAQRVKKSTKEKKVSEAELLNILQEVIDSTGGRFGVVGDSVVDSPPETFSVFKKIADLAGDKIHGNKCKDISFDNILQVPPAELSYGDLIIVKTKTASFSRETSRTVGVYKESSFATINGEKVGFHEALLLSKDPVGDLCFSKAKIRVSRAEKYFGFSNFWRKVRKSLKDEESHEDSKEPASDTESL